MSPDTGASLALPIIGCINDDRPDHPKPKVPSLNAAICTPFEPGGLTTPLLHKNLKLEPLRSPPFKIESAFCWRSVPVVLGETVPTNPQDYGGQQPLNYLESYGESNELTVNLNKFLTFTSVTGYRHLTSNMRSNNDGGVWNLVPLLLFERIPTR